MIKIIKLTLIASIAVFLSACWHGTEEVVKTEDAALSAALVETDMMPSRSK